MHTRTLFEVMMDVSLGTTEIGHICMLYQSAPSWNYCLEAHYMHCSVLKWRSSPWSHTTRQGWTNCLKIYESPVNSVHQMDDMKQFLFRRPTIIVSHDSTFRHLGDVAPGDVRPCNKTLGFSVETATAYTTGNIVLLG